MASKTLVLCPEGWPIEFRRCRLGLFVYKGSVYVKVSFETSYLSAYEGSNGHCFEHGKNVEERDELIVQPVTYKWVYATVSEEVA